MPEYGNFARGMPVNITPGNRAMRALLAALSLGLCGAAWAAPIPVKVVVVSMYQIGKLTDDKPGEAHLWVERQKLDRVLPFPLGEYELRMNDAGLLLICTGGGVTNSSTSIMALGLDPRFDLSHAYWLVAGIAGGNPAHVSLGSAVWANWVVDTDLSYEIDAREIPSDSSAWSTGRIPLRKTKPFEEPAAPMEGQVFEANHGLTEWAYSLTKGTPLQDSDKLKEIRTHFDSAMAHNPPQVLMGDEVSGSTYWHGKRLN